MSKPDKELVEEIALIIHKAIFEEDMSENTPVRNLQIYGVAQAIASKLKPMVDWEHMKYLIPEMWVDKLKQSEVEWLKQSTGE